MKPGGQHLVVVYNQIISQRHCLIIVYFVQCLTSFFESLVIINQNETETKEILV